MNAGTRADIGHQSDPLSIEHLSDHELLASTKRLVGRSNQVFAALLAHLAEVEARGVHRTRACSSLYTYCIYELRLSEDAAFRRVAAARLVKRFPAVLDAIERGELHLTGLLMLGPHLTLENHLEVLARSKHRTKKEIAGLVRILHPLPSVPARIEPLGPAPARPATLNPNWATVVHLPVRHLAPGERPADWTLGTEALGTEPTLGGEPSPERVDESHDGAPLENVDREPALARRYDDRPPLEDASAQPTLVKLAGSASSGEPAELGSRRLEGPQRYLVQFTATEEYVSLYEEAKALLSHTPGARTVEAVHLRAMRAFVEGLRKRKYAWKGQSGQRSPRKACEKRDAAAAAVLPPPSGSPPPGPAGASCEHEGKSAASKHESHESSDKGKASSTGSRAAAENAAVLKGRLRDGSRARSLASNGRDGASHRDDLLTHQDDRRCSGDGEGRPEQRTSARHGRYLRAAVRREVFKRDEGRCTYVDELGGRCRETGRLEFHHIDPFGRGGTGEVPNVTLRCREHNALAAEEDFGREFMAAKRDGLAHELKPVSGG